MKVKAIAAIALTALMLGGCAEGTQSEVSKTEAVQASETFSETETTRESVVSEEFRETEPAAESKEFTTVSGEFTVYVIDVIPDYIVDGSSPRVALVKEFLNYPFTLPVGEEIGSQLEKDQHYVFTIDPFTVEYPADFLKKMGLPSLVWEFVDFSITDFRVAEEDEKGLSSKQLTYTPESSVEE